jgi:hypothetical protein
MAAFPNAQVAISPKDYYFWADLGKISPNNDEIFNAHFRSAHKSLSAYANRIVLVEDGSEVVPGIRAIAVPWAQPGAGCLRDRQR